MIYGEKRITRGEGNLLSKILRCLKEVTTLERTLRKNL